jgi:hypothetical protein
MISKHFGCFGPNFGLLFGPSSDRYFKKILCGAGELVLFMNGMIVLGLLSDPMLKVLGGYGKVW